MTPKWFHCFSQPVPVPAHPLTDTQDKAWLTASPAPKLHQEPPADVIATRGPSEPARPQSALQALAPGCDLTWPVPRRNSTVSSCSEPAPPLPIAMACYHGRCRAHPMTTSVTGLLGPEEYGVPEAARDGPHALGQWLVRFQVSPPLSLFLQFN